jgi:hypothetical protein
VAESQEQQDFKAKSSWFDNLVERDAGTQR